MEPFFTAITLIMLSKHSGDTLGVALVCHCVVEQFVVFRFHVSAALAKFHTVPVYGRWYMVPRYAGHTLVFLRMRRNIAGKFTTTSVHHHWQTLQTSKVLGYHGELGARSWKAEVSHPLSLPSYPPFPLPLSLSSLPQLTPLQ